MDPLPRTIAIIALVACWAGPAVAEQGPRETVETADQRIRELLKTQPPEGSKAATARDEQLKAVVNSLLDLDAMAQEALGREWSKRSEAERREYMTLMHQLVERSYLRQAESRTQYQLQVGAVDVQPNGTAEVETTLTFVTRGRRENIEIVYSLTRRDGRWRVTDIETDGASTVRNYRTQFRRIIQNQGFGELLVRMRRRLAEGAADL